MKNPSRGFATLVLICIVALLLVSGGVYLYTQKLNFPTTNNKSNGSSTTTVSAIDDKTGWKTFTSDEYGISFAYPPELYVTATSLLYGEKSPSSIAIRNYDQNDPRYSPYSPEAAGKKFLDMPENGFGFGFYLGSSTSLYSDETFDAWTKRMAGGSPYTLISIDGVPAVRIDETEGGMGTRAGFILLISPKRQAVMIDMPSSSDNSYQYFKPYFDKILPTIKFAR